MKADLRDTGIAAVGDAAWGTHLCQFYWNKHDLLEVLVPYFKAGLQNNEYCMWVTSDPLTVAGALAALKKAVPRVDLFLEQGQLEVLPHTDWFLRCGYFDLNRVLNGWVEKLDRAKERGFAGLRLSGNTAWLEEPDWRGFLEYEDTVNQALGNFDIIALCTYALPRCNPEAIMDVVSTHQYALLKSDSDWVLIDTAQRQQAWEKVLAEVRKGSTIPR